jgi:hypothetical protein
VHAVVDALAQHFDFRHGVEVFAGDQAAQVGDQFFEFCLGGVDGGRHTSLSVK